METLSEVRASLELGILVSTVLQNPGDKWWGPRGGWDVVFSLVVMPGVALGAERPAVPPNLYHLLKTPGRSQSTFFFIDFVKP